MSIIAEALEKAQKAGQKPAQKTLKAPFTFPKRFAIAFLLFLLIPLFYFLRQTSLNNPSLAPRESAQGKPAPSGESVEKAEAPAEEAREAEESFLPAVFSPAPADEIARTIKLTGIMHAPEKPLAVINGSIWGEGEYVGNFKILEIGRDYLDLESDGRVFTVRLKR